MKNNDLKNIIKPDKTYSQYTSDELKIIISNSSSIHDVIQKLNINRTYHFTISKFIKENNIDTSHFTYSKSINVVDELKENSKANSKSVKNYLLKNKIITYNCDDCKISNWRNKPITLQLDHINGVHYDNRIINLRLLCPNCHSQTKTYAGRNVKKIKITTKLKCIVCEKDISKNSDNKLCRPCYRKNGSKLKNQTFNLETEKNEYIKNPTSYHLPIEESKKNKIKCIKCDKKLSKGTKNDLCIDCFNLSNRKVDRPTIEVLINDIDDLGYVRTGLKYGMSDGGIVKWIELINKNSNEINEESDENNKITQSENLSCKSNNEDLSYESNNKDLDNKLCLESNKKILTANKILSIVNDNELSIKKSSIKLSEKIKTNQKIIIVDNNENDKVNDKVNDKDNDKICKCEKCGAKITGNGKTKLCNACFKTSSRLVDRPSLEELIEKIKELGYSGTGRLYGVSDNSIRKWIKNYNNN